MLTVVNIIIALFLLYFVYRLIRMVISAIPLWIAQANDLERRFGADVRAAAKYQFLGIDDAANHRDVGNQSANQG